MVLCYGRVWALNRDAHTNQGHHHDTLRQLHPSDSHDQIRTLPRVRRR